MSAAVPKLYLFHAPSVHASVFNPYIATGRQSLGTGLNDESFLRDTAFILIITFFLFKFFFIFLLFLVN